MENEQGEMQFLGLLGILKESFNIILSRKKIFTQITLSLILPLSFIILTHKQASNAFSTMIIHNEEEMTGTPEGTPQYQTLSDKIISELAAFNLFNLAYSILILALSPLSTSAVVYTMATLYTAAAEESPTLRKVTSFAPKVWKRLMVTSLCTSLAFFVYDSATGLVMSILSSLVTLLIGGSIGSVAIFVGLIVLLLYVAGFLYLHAGLCVCFCIPFYRCFGLSSER